MATRKKGAAKRSTTSRKAPAGRRPSSRSSTRRRRTPRRRTTGYAPRRRRPTLSTTLGAALGTLLVTTLFEASWPVRIGLVVAVVVVGLAYVLWTNRAAIAAAGEQAAPAESTATDTPAEPFVTGDPDLPAAVATEPPASIIDPSTSDKPTAQGDSPR